MTLTKQIVIFLSNVSNLLNLFCIQVSFIMSDLSLSVAGHLSKKLISSQVGNSAGKDTEFYTQLKDTPFLAHLAIGHVSFCHG